MLLSFKVKNYRSIKEEVSLDLLATSDDTLLSQNVFVANKLPILKSIGVYGPNASGKSNILKAYMVFRSMILESLIRANLDVDLSNEFFKLSSTTENKPSRFEMTFLIDEDEFVYGFEISKKQVEAEWLIKIKGKVEYFVRKKQDIEHNKNYFREATAILKKQTGERVLFLSVLSANNQPLSKKIVDFIQNSNYVSGTNRGVTLNYSLNQFLSGEDMAKKMRDWMVNADFGITDIVASQRLVSSDDIREIPDKFKELIFKKDSKITERRLKFSHSKYDKDRKKVGDEFLDFFAEESEGTQQFFALVAPLIDTLNHGKVLFIDEIDASLHPQLCKYIVTVFNSKKGNPKNAQLVFTTHDISLLDVGLLRRDQVYFTEKNKFGATKLFSLSDISERKGLNFAKRYMEGRYDALPYLSDYQELEFSRGK